MRARAGGAAILAVLIGSVVAGGTAPAQTLPDVSVPKVQTPTVPAPLPQTPKLPSVPGAGQGGGDSGVGGGSGVGGSAGGLGGVAGSGSGAVSGDSAGPGTTGSGYGAGAGGSGGGSPPSASGGSGTRATEPAERRRVREARLRRSVSQLRGCLAALTPFQRQVLSIRTGLLSGSGSSRAATAERLRTSSLRIATAEVRGVRRLRQASRARGCAGTESVGDAVTTSALSAAVASAGDLGSGTTSGEQVAERPSAGSDQNAVLGASDSSDEQRSDDGEIVLGAPPGAADSELATDDGAPTLILWLVALALISASALVLIRRRLARTTRRLPPASSPAPWAEDV